MTPYRTVVYGHIYVCEYILIVKHRKAHNSQLVDIRIKTRPTVSYQELAHVVVLCVSGIHSTIGWVSILLIANYCIVP